MRHKILNLQHILEKNRYLNSYFQDNPEKSDSELELLRHQLLDLEYYNHLIGSADIGDDPELSDSGE